MDDDNTFILLYRKSINSRVFRNDALWKVWTWCLLKASYKERWVTMITGKSEIEVKIHPGQFVYGRFSAAKELNMKPSSVRNRMEKLKNMRNVDIKEDSQYSIVSIINWDAYQIKKNKEDIKEDSRGTIKGQSKDTNNKVNKVEKVNNKDIYTPNFTSFWESYPKKIGKGAAFKSYQNIKEPRPSLDIILNAVTEQNKSKQWQNNQFIPNPSTWLNQRRWDDEIKESPEWDF